MENLLPDPVVLVYSGIKTSTHAIILKTHNANLILRYKKGILGKCKLNSGSPNNVTFHFQFNEIEMDLGLVFLKFLLF